MSDITFGAWIDGTWYSAEQLQRLKAENEELKKQINDAERYIDELQDALSDMELKKENNKDRYRKALEEIRESFSGFRISTMPFHIADNEKMPHRMADAIQHYSERIIVKINEVLKDE